MAANRELRERAKQTKSVGISSAASPWLIHTGSFSPRPAKMPLFTSSRRSAGQNNSGGIFALDLGQRRSKRQDFTIHLRLAHPPRDQLCVLAAEVENDDHYLPMPTLCAFWKIFPSCCMAGAITISVCCNP